MTDAKFRAREATWTCGAIEPERLTSDSTSRGQPPPLRCS